MGFLVIRAESIEFPTLVCQSIEEIEGILELLFVRFYVSSNNEFCCCLSLLFNRKIPA